ncbi:MAG: head fiber protein, partial [Candidatus Limiplasma sp.]|nr:head fiber protein [Candidatus Limiplasma sp.]
NELVIGGKLTFLPGATIEGSDDLFGQSEPAAQIAYIADSEATTIAALKDDFNGLLAALRNAGLMASGQ